MGFRKNLRSLFNPRRIYFQFEYALEAFVKYILHKLNGGSVSMRMHKYRHLNGNIKISSSVSPKRIALFVAYHSRDSIPISNIKYIESLSKVGFSIFYIHNGPLLPNIIEKLSTICHKVVCRPNVGSDCGAWKDAYLFFKSKGFFKNVEWLLFCNDSNLFLGGTNAENFRLRFSTLLSESEHDLIALSKNYELHQHYQSFFLCMRSTIFMSHSFYKFWKKYTPFTHRFYSIDKCEIRLTKKIFSHYSSHVMYDSVTLYDNICSEKNVISNQFLSLLPKNAMHLSCCVEGDNLYEFELQKILSILTCHNPSHSLALLFVEYMQSPFLKKDLVMAGSYSLTQLQSIVKRYTYYQNDSSLKQEIMNLYVSRGLNTSYINRPRFSYRKGINPYEGMYLGGWGDSLKNMGFD